MSEEKRKEIERIMADAMVEHSAQYCGETTRDNNWKCDEWLCSFEKQTRNNPENPYQVEEFEFYTGLGLRHPVNTVSRRMQTQLNPRSVAWHEIEKTRKPKPPHPADVLYSVVMASSACEQSFADWCYSFEYDTDSRKALATYEACQRDADKLKRIFNHAQLAQIREIVQDY